MSEDDPGARSGRDAAARRAARSADAGSDRGPRRVRVVGEERVRGVEVDAATRCAHYGTDRDVVAIRFACCERFYPCHACHDAVAEHDAERWPRSSFDAPAILCGACGTVLSIETYLDCEHACPDCGHAFNPGCAAHADRYFDV